MTTSKKIEALVQKSIENGYSLDLGGIVYTDNSHAVIHYLPRRATEGWNILLFDHDLARALFGEKKKEWLGRFVWYSKYEQDSYTFKDANDLLNSWVYSGGGQKPTITELESLPAKGIEACAGIIEKWIETTNEGFKYHLQQAVVSDNPIDYMYGVVFDD